MSRRKIDWMTIRDCSCKGAGCIESDYAPGTFYPCVTCNPDWCRIKEPPTWRLAGEPLRAARTTEGT